MRFHDFFKFILSAFLILITTACPNGQPIDGSSQQPAPNPVPNPAPSAKTQWLTPADIASIIPGSLFANQAAGDVVPPQLTFSVAGSGQAPKSVFRSGSPSPGGDLFWSAQIVILQRMADGTMYVLTQKRANFMSNGGKIEAPGGSLTPALSWREGAQAELEQEAGVSLSTALMIIQAQPNLRLAFNPPNNPVGNANFFAMFTGDRPKTDESSHEIDKAYGHRWVSFDDLLQLAILERPNPGQPDNGTLYFSLRQQLLYLARNEFKIIFNGTIR